MLNIVLTHDEVQFLFDRLKLKPAVGSPFESSLASAKKLTEAKHKQLQTALKKGGTLVTDKGHKDLRVNTVVTGALGILAAPQSYLDLLITHAKGKVRRSFYGVKHTFVELIETDKKTFVISLPVTEEMLRNYVLKDLRTENKTKFEFVLAGDEIELAAALSRLVSEGKKETTKTALDAVLQKTNKQIDAAVVLDKLEKKDLVAVDGDKVAVGASLAALYAAQRLGQMLQLSRVDFDEQKPAVRSLQLWQGKDLLVLQQTVLGTPLCAIFATIDLDQATLLLTLLTHRADSFVQAYDKVFAKPLTRAAVVAPTEVEEPNPVDVLPEGTPVAATETVPGTVEQTEPEVTAAPAPIPVLTPAASTPVASESTEAPVEAAILCAKCQQPLPTGAKFCRNCGEKVVAVIAKPVCAGCGIELPENAKFCRHCGKKVEK